MITKDQLLAIFPYAKTRISIFIDPINSAMIEFGINNPKRQAAFLAQIGHESGQLRYVKELASGEAYEERTDLGNTKAKDGDGPKYKGRGLIQITGHNNYTSCGVALGLDLINHPELLEEPINACRSAAWFWKTHGLNELADKGDFILITKRINGGTNGLADRQDLYDKACKVLNVVQ